MNVDLGGAGPGCSATRVRRLHAGELQGGERERVQAHVVGCARCQGTERELVLERAAVRAAVPFGVFAAGVAEKLAAQSPARAQASSRVTHLQQRRLVRWAAPLAVAASVCLAVFVSLQGRDEQRTDAGHPGPYFGLKGGGVASVIVQDARGLRKLGGEPVAPDARLKIELDGSSRKHAAILLVEAGETSILYAGPAQQGPQPGAFVWTGSAQRATVLVVLSDSPLDVTALQQRGKSAAPKDAEVIELFLTR